MGGQRPGRAPARDDVPTGAPATLRRRLGVVLAASGATLLLILAAAAYSLVQVISLQGKVTDFYFDAITVTDRLQGWLQESGAAIEAFATVGFEPGLDPVYDVARVPVRDLGERFVEELGPDNPLVADLDAAVAASSAWREDYAMAIIAIDPVEGLREVPAELARDGERLYADATESAKHLSDALDTARADTAEQLSSWTGNLFLTVILLTLAALAVGIGIWLSLQRRVLDPLADLASKAEAVSGGALDQVVRTQAPGEIASLANAVDAMRVELVAQMAAASASRAAIEEAHRYVSEQAEELRRSNRDLEQFAYVASHDLQEPLRKVASFTQLLQKRYGGQLDDRADQYIEFAVDGAKRMQQLIQGLLGFSRVGRSVEEPQDVDLREALDAALANLAGAIEDSGAQIDVDDLPVVLGQQTLLVQLFQNLVGNAIKFRAADRPPRIVIGATHGDRGWELSCSDNGIGVDMQYADRVFVIFQRLHPKDVYEGTGIGLALCKKIVEHHGGEIWIDNAERDGEDQPGGTTIRWTIPEAVRGLGAPEADQPPLRDAERDDAIVEP